MVGRRAQADRASWVDRGYEVLLSRGAAALTVEGLARDLGVTKGSFYWHFAGRDELLAAVLTRWTEERTAEVIAAAEQADAGEQSGAGDPVRALRTVIGRVGDVRTGETRLYVPADQQHPLVAAAVDAVTRTRVEYLAMLLGRLGHSAEDATARARAALALAIGQQLLAEAVPAQKPDAAAGRRAAALALHLLHPAAAADVSD